MNYYYNFCDKANIYWCIDAVSRNFHLETFLSIFPSEIRFQYCLTRSCSKRDRTRDLWFRSSYSIHLSRRELIKNSVPKYIIFLKYFTCKIIPLISILLVLGLLYIHKDRYTKCKPLHELHYILFGSGHYLFGRFVCSKCGVLLIPRAIYF